MGIVSVYEDGKILETAVAMAVQQCGFSVPLDVHIK